MEYSDFIAGTRIISIQPKMRIIDSHNLSFYAFISVTLPHYLLKCKIWSFSKIQQARK